MSLQRLFLSSSRTAAAADSALKSISVQLLNKRKFQSYLSNLSHSFRLFSTIPNNSNNSNSSPSPPSNQAHNSNASASASTSSSSSRSSSSSSPLENSSLPDAGDSNPTTFTSSSTHPPMRSRATRRQQLYTIGGVENPTINSLSQQQPQLLPRRPKSSQITQFQAPIVEPEIHLDLIQPLDFNQYQCENPWYYEFPKYQSATEEYNKLEMPKPLPSIYININNINQFQWNNNISNNNTNTNENNTSNTTNNKDKNNFSNLFNSGIFTLYPTDFPRHSTIDLMKTNQRIFHLFTTIFMILFIKFIIINGQFQENPSKENMNKLYGINYIHNHRFIYYIRNEYEKFMKVLWNSKEIIYIKGSPPDGLSNSELMEYEENIRKEYMNSKNNNNNTNNTNTNTNTSTTADKSKRYQKVQISL